MTRDHVVTVFFPRWREGQVEWTGVDQVRRSLEPPDILLTAWEIVRRREILDALEKSCMLDEAR